MTYIKKLVMQGFKSFVKKTELPFTEGINVILGPNGSGKSARWDTEVLLASGGKKPIGEIVEESLEHARNCQKIEDGLITRENPLGVRILSLNPKTMKVEESDVMAFIKRDGEPNLYTIKTNTGKEVTTTACHPILIYKNGKIVSEVVGNLKKGDFIATPNKINLFANNIKINLHGLEKDKSNSEEFARFLGYIIGDGCIIKNSRVDFVNADKEILEDYRKSAEFIGFKTSIAERKGSITKNVYLNSKSFANELISFFNNNYKKEGKHIPKEILFGDKLILANFLAALFDCDSSVRKDNPTFEYVTMSEKLAEDTILGLLRFGIVARKTKKFKYASNTELKRKKGYFFITIEGKEKISQLYRSIPLRCIHKRELLKKWAENPIKCNTNNDLLPREVNLLIKETFQLCGIKIKPLRKGYPLLAAYIENRCNASRDGIKRIIPVIEKKLAKLNELYEKIALDQNSLINCMTQLNIPGQEASKQINLNNSTVMRCWASGKFKARPENLQNFYYLIKRLLEERLVKIKEGVDILKALADSEIFWDKIKKIEKVKGEKYVYDLEVENNHNFIANNIFVHNSNVTDALCFVLGRLSAKSMRAAKAGNLIFLGSKSVPAAKEASVELVFDNSSRVFAIEKDEVSIKRIVRKNGLSIYKINEETKTRQDVLGLLAQAGIDPNGFNIILQGEIQNFVRMNGEERRGIIEEVAGISIYESRKERSLHELEKTEEKLKEVTAILRERTSYLNNLEKERQQALKFKKLEADVQKYKASIVFHDLSKKKKEVEIVEKEIEIKNKEVEKIKKRILDIRAAIENFENKIGNINSMIQKSAGIEQEKLNQEIANTMAELAGLTVKLDNYEKKISEIERQKQSLQETIRNNELSIRELQKESPSLSQKGKELAKKKQDLERLEEERKKFYTTRAELKMIRERIQDKQGSLQSYNNESNFLVKQIENISAGLFDKKFDQDKIEEIKNSLRAKREGLEIIEKKERELQQIIHTDEFEISRQEKIIENIAKMDMCPLCKNKITKEHISNINKEVEPRISALKKEIEASIKEVSLISKERNNLKDFVEKAQEEISKRESDSIKISEINSKKDQIKDIQEKIDKIKQELSELDKKRKYLDENFDENSGIEQKCELIRVEIQEISLRSEETVNSEVSFKQRELERAKISLKQMISEYQELEEEIVKVKKIIKEKEELVEKKKQQEEELSKKFQKLIAERDHYQTSIRENESEMLREQNRNYSFEQEMNNFKISKAKVDAEIENLEIEMLNFPNVEIIKASKESLTDKLNSVKDILTSIGSVNLRALEVYDSIKQEYDAINQKVEIISKEKEGIMKIIQEIDIKKKKTFLRTLEALNEIFSRNFAQLSMKGEVYLELENKKEPFEGGVGIVVKTGHGKYFDVTSLSGGEQTLVALSLIFGIQELKPYSFYILDEIDAALDKRNSERLAGLLRKYMEKGQYLVITHNDEVISRATNLYGVSMNEGISKVVSLKI